ncbi:DUF3097 domain-containing protein [Cellulomonas sp. APG4]|uniref:DUF3097 domain-containing protein n=1 Tax=Cellulomonas sp. APG4 TaxID=1538656 RepID=UPI00137ABBF5|nr:DUF3097 domain-containing protein [Cellulomonas sp. APG4]NCT90199.1 DUF3097 domain-containing protein [Cellulomonas sp. APG4]
MHDRYGPDVLAGARATHHRAPRTSRPTPAATGLVVEEVTTGWVGAVTRVEKSGGTHVVVLEDRNGRTRTFPLGPGFWVDGEPVELTAPTGPAPTRPTRTASGSRAVTGARARVARASRIWVEGRHDAELVEKVWGDDLRVEGVVVEMLDGVDDLVGALAEFGPSAQRRVGVLVDHLVPGSKESRIAEQATRSAPAGSVLVLGHPYVDVWQAVRPGRLGLDRWPVIERGTEWKHGILRELGWPHGDQADVARAWKRILGTVRDYRDLEPTLLGRVEELIDFVTG